MSDLFTVRLAVTLGLRAAAASFPKMAFLFGGIPGAIIGFFATKALGFLVTKGILQIDLTLDAIKVGMETREFRELAFKAYEKATARIYTEEEKVAIRHQYLDAIRKFARVGNGLRDGQHGS